MLVDEELNEEVSEFVRDKIRETVDDPETARKLLPDYHFGTKRLILDNGYFETYNRDNVSLVDLREDPIEAFTRDECPHDQAGRAPDRHARVGHRVRRRQRLDAEDQPQGPGRDPPGGRSGPSGSTPTWV